MKKIIALVITVMMIASLFVTGVSAVRVADAEYVTTPAETSKVLNTTVGDDCYIYCSDLNVAGKDVEFDLYFEDGAGTYSDVWGLAWLNMHTDKIGVGGTTINSDALTPGTWHRVVYSVGSGETEISVDGTVIGTVAVALDKFACGIEGAKFDNIVVGDKSQDFEGYEIGYDAVGAGRWYFSSDGAGGSSIQMAEKAPASTDLVVNYNENRYSYYNKFLDTTIGDGCYIYCSDLGVSNRTVAFDLYFEEGAGTYSDVWGLQWLNLHTDKIGVGSTTIATDALTPGAWHHVVYEVGSGETEISVDGTVIGTVAAQLDKFACGIEGAKFDNIVAGDKSQDFEGYDVGADIIGAGRWYFSSDGAGGSVISQELATKAFDLGRYYWNWDEDNCYAYINGLNGNNAKWELDLMLDPTSTNMASYFSAGPIFAASTTDYVQDKYIACRAHGQFGTADAFNGVTDNYTFKIVLKSSTDYFENANLGETVTYINGSPKISMKEGFLGYHGIDNTLSYTFSDDTLYTIEYVVDGDTTVFVNGEEIGTLPGHPQAMFYGVMYRYLIKEISWSQNGTAFKSENAANYNVDDTVGFFADAPVISLGTNAVVTPGEIGVAGTRLPYDFTPGVWYHVVLDGEDGNDTDIYVDGAYVGSVGTAIKAEWCGHPGQIKIDNLKITGNGNDYFEDFEDTTFGAADGNGYAVLYDFDLTPPEPEHDIFYYIDTEEPGGSAFLVSGGYNYEIGQDPTDVGQYFDFTGVNPGGRHEYVINFDLALIPETDTTGNTWFEIWTNTASRRWIVGTTQTGRSDNGSYDVTAFDWGEATKDNFHNVTYEFRNTNGRIYVDGELVYENKAGTTWDNLMIGYTWNGTAIIDNVKLYGFTDDNPLQPNTLDEIAVGFNGEDDVRVINLDADDFCAANGHIQEHTDRTTQPYCTTTGIDTTYCAICGEAVKTTVVPELGHNWPNYYNGVQKDGNTWSWACKRCGEVVSTTVPEISAGTIGAALDFEDARVVQGVADKFNADGQVVSDGVGHFEAGCGQNYNQFTLPGNDYKNNYTVAFDLKINGTFDDNDTGSYGHTVFFWFGGQGGINNEAGYDADNHQFFIRAWNTTTAYDEVTEPYLLTEGEWYNIMFKVYAPENGTDYVKIFVNGEEVIHLTGADVADYVSSPSGIDFSILRDFGVTADIDNFVIGTADLAFEAEAVTPGDINGDGKITTKDLKLLKLIIAGGYVPTDAEYAAADFDGNGSVTAADLAAMKAYIAGANA